jgi:parallel beta-helix repeat protein
MKAFRLSILFLIVLLVTGTEGLFAQKLKHNQPIFLNGVSNMTISGYTISGEAVDCIRLIDCKNIHITNCRLINSKRFGIYLYNCSNILIDSNYIAKVGAGVFAQTCPLGQIRVNNNQMLNMLGTLPYNKDFVQFAEVSGPGNKICYNKLENISGQSNPEDAINLYKCNGLPDDPITIIGNWIRGGGPSTTGSGITVGDQGGSYQLAQDNILVNTGFIGMQVAGGTYIRIINNTIYSDAFPWSHLGLGYGNYSGKPSTHITIRGNRVHWLAGWAHDQYKGSKSKEFDMYYHKMPSMPDGLNENIFNAPIDPTILPKELVKAF